MKITDRQIKNLSLKIYKKLEENRMIEVLAPTEVILKKIESLIMADARIEDEIEKQAKALLEKVRPQIESGQVDAHEMYIKIKNQLMKDKKFTK